MLYLLCQVDYDLECHGLSNVKPNKANQACKSRVWQRLPETTRLGFNSNPIPPIAHVVPRCILIYGGLGPIF